MPMYKQVESLNHMCYLLLSEYIHKVSVDLEENENPMYMDKDSLQKVVSTLPAVFVEKIIVKVIDTIIRNVNRNRRTIGMETCLEVLLQPHVGRLDLSGLFFKMRLPSHINTNIRNVVCQSLCKMQNLTYLNLVSKCDDRILLAVSRYCKNISNIVISLSDLVTDEGVKFISKDCHSLEKLEIYKCWGVTPLGVKYAIVNCRNLKELHCDELGLVFLKYLRGVQRKFKLIHFEQTCTSFEPSQEDAEWIGQICPEIHSIRFATEDDYLYFISKISDTLRVAEFELTTIGKGFEKAIIDISSTLSTLNLSCEIIHQRHVTLIGNSCKNLVTFHLTTASIDQDQDLKNDGALFSNLSSLHLQIWKESVVDAALVEYFLVWCQKLRYVVIKAQMDFFTDDFLKRVLQANNLEFAVKLNITADKYVPLTVSSVPVLMSSCPALESLSVSSWDVDEDEFFQLRQELKQNNYSLSIT